MVDIKEILKDKRPNLSDSSLTTYNSILRNLYKKVFPDDKETHLQKFDEPDKILTYLKDVEPNKRKTVLSALVVLTSNEKYRQHMLTDIEKYSQLIKQQIKSPAQEANWVTMDEVRARFKELEDESKLIYKKKTLTMSDVQQIQQMVILALLGGVFIPVRRSLDYVSMKKGGQINKEKDNWFDKKQFHYQKYKTKKFYGEQTLPIPPALRKIIEKYATMMPHTDYLLFDNNSLALTSVKLNQRLCKIFAPKNASCNILRHSYLTEKYGDEIQKQKAISKTMSDMGTSANMLTTYVKHT